MQRQSFEVIKERDQKYLEVGFDSREYTHTHTHTHTRALKELKDSNNQTQKKWRKRWVESHRIKGPESHQSRRLPGRGGKV